MSLLTDAITDALRTVFIDGITDNVSHLISDAGATVQELAADAGKGPIAWNASLYAMVRSLSDSYILPIAGVFLALLMTWELVTMLTERHTFRELDTSLLFLWVGKSALAVYLVSHGWDLLLAIFDVAGSVAQAAGGTVHSVSQHVLLTALGDFTAQLEEMNLGSLLGLWLQTLFVGLFSQILTVLITLLLAGRMLEIYLTTSLLPLPMSTFFSRDFSHVGKNYLLSLFALAFQAFLIVILLAMYSVLANDVILSDSISVAIWRYLGLTTLLCFGIYKTAGLSRSIFCAH